MLLANITKTVIVPFDFSELSIEGLRKTLKMVDDPSLVKVIYVSQYPAASEYGVIWDTITPDSITKNLMESFRNDLEEAGGFPELELNVVFGSPGTEIARFAIDHDAELIVMPSHGRSGFTRLMLGSVAERVLRLAECPVLILRDLVDPVELPEGTAASLIAV